MIRFFYCPDTGRKENVMKKRPLAYITAPWGENEFENTEKAAKYCRDAYEAGFSPFCPVLVYPMFLRDDIPQEHNDMKAMARDILQRSTVLVVCGGTADEDVMDDIAIARRYRVATTTLDGILLAKGKGRHD